MEERQKEKINRGKRKEKRIEKKFKTRRYKEEIIGGEK